KRKKERKRRKRRKKSPVSLLKGSGSPNELKESVDLLGKKAKQKMVATAFDPAQLKGMPIVPDQQRLKNV
ncbi:MAG TPA: hypothetical protein DEB18_06695, partial [Leeuwenhoekiella sp.]|nr:hypothetical protein [Leeuwenhoekiella sp.]